MKQWIIIGIGIIIVLYEAVNSCATIPRYWKNMSITQADIKICKYSQLGFLSFGRLGDINGDGYEDFSVGDWKSGQADYPMVAIFFGRQTWRADYNFSTADIVLNHFAHEIFGKKYSVVPGDLNGDGYDDLVITTGSAIRGGKVFVTYGRKDVRMGYFDIRSFSDLQVIYGTLGYGTQYCGDFNGDGYDDLAMWESNWFSYEDPADFFVIPGKQNSYKGKIDLWSLPFHFGVGSGTFGYNQFDINDDGRDEIVTTRSTKWWNFLWGRETGFPKGWGIYSESSGEYIFIRMIDQSGFADQSFFSNFLGRPVPDFIAGDFNPWRPQIGPGRVNIIPGTPRLYQYEVDLNLNAWFTSEQIGDRLGESVFNGGDVNSDGYDDIVFAANHYGDRRQGKVYCALGGPDKWIDKNMSASLAEMSFIGENFEQKLGLWMANIGDVNGDAIDDWGIGGVGRAYVIFPALNQRPFPIHAIHLYHDSAYSQSYSRPYKIWENLFIEVSAVDKDITTRNVCEVVLTSGGYPNPRGMRIRCKETGDNTGIFHGGALLSDTGANRFARRLRVTRNDTVTVTSWEDGNISTSALVRDVTPTNTPTFTWTPSRTPTMTPTPKPKIIMAGYADTRLQTGQEGTVTAIAVCGSLEPTVQWNKYWLELWYEGVPTGLLLLDGSLNGPYLNDDIFYNQWDVGAPSGTQTFLFELSLYSNRDGIGIQDWWPYLEVKP